MGTTHKIFYALSTDGDEKWKFNTDYGIYSSPVIGVDGHIYVASFDKLYVLNTNGVLKWEIQLDEFTYSAPILADDGTLYLGGSSKLYAIRTFSLGTADTPWPQYGGNNRNTGNVADN